MVEEAPGHRNASPGAVFLSYASQDAEAARKIRDALQAGGIEVFLDQSELRGGDVWDQKIRHEIHDCALFIPIISRHTQERLEGYFRHEWNLAVERAHHMARQKHFLVPVVIDGTGDREALVPDEYRTVQWTHLPAGDTPLAFVDRIRRLLSPDHPPVGTVPVDTVAPRAAGPASWRPRPVPLVIAAIIVLGAGAYVLARKPWIPKQPAAVVAFAPPRHSVAVLPFVNLSGDPKQDYFSDGLSEELLNSLVTVHDLRVAARTSSFHFKGKDVDLAGVARKLNVGAILEGSVRKEGNRVRISAQLINAVTGFNLWSHSYDRDLKNVLTLQSEIAGAVTEALQATLLTDASAAIELGGTQNPQAFDAYLRGEKLEIRATDKKALLTRIAAYDEAIRLDPKFAKAYVGKATALSTLAGDYSDSSAETAQYFAQARADSEQAIVLAPDLGRAHMALGSTLLQIFDFPQGLAETERALALSPGDAWVLASSAWTFSLLGRGDLALANAQRAVALDPLNPEAYESLSVAHYFLGQYRQSIEALDRAVRIDPSVVFSAASEGWGHLALGDNRAAVEDCIRLPLLPDNRHTCLAIAYHRLGQAALAQQMLTKLEEQPGDFLSYQFAEIHAQWGDVPQALEWLETAYRRKDTGLVLLKKDVLLDPLRQEPRFQAVMRKLQFPD